MQRMYDVYWFRASTGGKLNSTSMTHDEACTFKSKMTNYPWRRLALVEV